MPISLVFIVLKNFIRPLKRRIDFERKNLIFVESISFKKVFKVADYCFEVSSEGELEQVRPLIEYYLSKNKFIEILFSSPSVEEKCQKMALNSNGLIRILRLPIASFFPIDFLYFQSPWSWVTAPTIFFCRYDFFPELLAFKFLGKKLILLSAIGKNATWFKTQCYSFFNMIVAANPREATFFENEFKHIPTSAFDFRMPRIFSRTKQSSKVLTGLPEIKKYLEYLDLLAANQKIILGSCWESDFGIFNNGSDLSNWIHEIKSGNIHLLIVPHKLGANDLLALKRSLEQLFADIPLYEIQKGEEFETLELKENPGIVILNMSGVLCEFYTRFNWAYVGGGFERSIHSVLEPFLSGCKVICGPKIMRSTEYDYICEVAPSEIHLLKNGESFYNIFKNEKWQSIDLVIRPKIEEQTKINEQAIINEIESC